MNAGMSVSVYLRVPPKFALMVRKKTTKVHPCNNGFVISYIVVVRHHMDVILVHIYLVQGIY